jgi:hypothetical protein
VTPANSTIAKGATLQFTASGTLSDKSTENLTSLVTWKSGTAATASISATGLATALADGTSTISAELNGITGSTTLTVGAPVLSPFAVKDTLVGGYLQYGSWTVAQGGYGGSYSIANPATASSASALWQFVVPAGSYDIWATWVNSASDASNATYSIFDGFNKLGAPQVNQQVAPTAGEYGGVLWTDLGTFSISNGRVTVALSDSGANGDVVADGILLVANPLAAAMAAPEAIASPTPAPLIATLPVGVVSASGPSQGSPPTNSTVPAPAAVPVSTSIGTTAQAASVTVIDANNSAIPGAAGNPAGGESSSLTDRALRKIAAKHRHKVHEALIERLARERVASAQRSARHHL